MDTTQTPPQQPLQTPIQIPYFQPKPNYLKIVIFPILAIITLGLIGYLIFQNQKLQNQIISQQIIPTTTVIKPLSTTPADETTSWKTYKNELIKYYVSYPPNWKIVQVGADYGVNIALVNENDNKVLYFISTENKDGLKLIDSYKVKSCFENSCSSIFNSNEKIIDRNIIKIGNMDTLTLNTQIQDKTQKYYFFTNTRFITMVQIMNVEKRSLQKIDQILSTFRFVDNSTKIVTEKKLSYIKSINSSTISLDLIEMISDNNQPNGYRIDNPSNETVNFPIEQNVLINQIVYPADGNMTNKTVSLSDFIKILESNSAAKDLPYWIDLKNGTVTKITEQYIP